MRPSGPVDLSVIIVNYNVARHVLGAVASLERQKFAGPNGRDGRLEILVIDNASSPEDVALLQGLPSGVVLVRNERNVGFAAANNQGIARASGRYLGFLNPDTTVLDGALDALLQHLYRHPETGAVGPRFWADDERTLLLPPGDPPTLSFLLGQIIGTAFPVLGEWHARRWHRYALRYWRSQGPLEVPMLPGTCMVTSRTAVDRVGGFDPAYFLYYEDTDWCRRFRRQGFRLMVVPEAEIVHYYNQSAKLDPKGAQGHALWSQVRFVKVHYGWPGLVLYRAMRAMSNRVASWRRPAPAGQVIDLGRLAASPQFSVRNGVPLHEVMIQIGYTCHFIPSAAAFVRHAEFQLPQGVWERMQPGRYYARMIDPETLRPLALWSWEKG